MHEVKSSRVRKGLPPRQDPGGEEQGRDEGVLILGAGLRCVTVRPPCLHGPISILTSNVGDNTNNSMYITANLLFSARSVADWWN